MSQPQKLLIQIVFNLVLLLIFLVALGSVIRDLLTRTGDLGENLFLLALLGAILFIGISDPAYDQVFQRRTASDFLTNTPIEYVTICSCDRGVLAFK